MSLSGGLPAVERLERRGDAVGAGVGAGAPSETDKGEQVFPSKGEISPSVEENGLLSLDESGCR